MIKAINIQDRLKTDEQARISRNKTLSICKTLPKIIDKNKNGKMIFFTW